MPALDTLSFKEKLGMWTEFGIDVNCDGAPTINSSLVQDFALYKLSSTASATATLAAPSKEGLFLGLNMVVDGGDIVVTVTGTYDAIHTAITFDDVGDWVMLYSIQIAANTYRWRAFAGRGTNVAEYNALSAAFDTAVRVGVKSNTANSTLTLAAATPRGLGIFADDGGANIADDVKCIEGRVLLTIDQSAGSIRGVMGHLKLLTGIDVTTGIYTGVQGYVELVGTHIAKTGSTFSCFDASLEIATSLTINSGGEACGIHVETTGAGTITLDSGGKCAGILIDKASGAASWPIGIYMPTGGIIQGLRIGDWVAGGAKGSAVVFGTTMNLYADGQLDVIGAYGETTANLTSAYSAKVARFRHVVTNNNTALTIAHETYGAVGQLVCNSATLNHLHAGLLGTLEGNTTINVSNGAYAYSVAAVMARIGGMQLFTATKPVCGFSAVFNGATLDSGASAAFAACATSTGNWTYLLAADNCDYFFYAAAGTNNENGCKLATVTPGATGDGTLRIKIDTTEYFIPFYAAGSISGE